MITNFKKKKERIRGCAPLGGRSRTLLSDRVQDQRAVLDPKLVLRADGPLRPPGVSLHAGPLARGPARLVPGVLLDRRAVRVEQGPPGLDAHAGVAEQPVFVPVLVVRVVENPHLPGRGRGDLLEGLDDVDLVGGHTGEALLAEGEPDHVVGSLELAGVEALLVEAVGQLVAGRLRVLEQVLQADRVLLDLAHHRARRGDLTGEPTADVFLLLLLDGLGDRVLVAEAELDLEHAVALVEGHLKLRLGRHWRPPGCLSSLGESLGKRSVN